MLENARWLLRQVWEGLWFIGNHRHSFLRFDAR